MQKHDAGLLGERCQRTHAGEDVLADLFGAAPSAPVEGEDADVFGIQALGHGDDLLSRSSSCSTGRLTSTLPMGLATAETLRPLPSRISLSRATCSGVQFGDVGAPGAADLNVAGAQGQQHGGLHGRVRIDLVAEA